MRAIRKAGLVVAAIGLTAAAGCGGGRPRMQLAMEPVAPAEVEPAPEFMPVPQGEIPTAAAEPAPESEGPAAYIIVPEDVLEISVYGDPDLTREVPVRPDGMISYTFVGDVRAAGRTIEEIRGELKERLSQYLRTPEVTVIAREFGRQKVYVGGEVRQPGVYYVTPRENSLVDIVFKAGLTTERADPSKAVLVRGGRIVPVDFGRVLRGDLSVNVPLQNDDFVYVPEAAERYIYVLGEIGSQGAIETTIPLGVLNVLARSGGVNAMAAKTKEIAVIRGGLKEPTVAIVNYKRLAEGDLSQNIQVLPGDIVYVPTSALGKYNQFIEQILRTFTLLFQGRVVQRGF